MNEDAFFHEATLQYGGMAPIMQGNMEPLLTNAKATTSRFHNSRKILKPLPTILFGYVNNPNFNAFATKHKGVYIIGVNHAVFYILHDLFRRILSRNDILLHIGNPKAEGRGEKTGYFTNLGILIGSFKGKYESIKPTDPVRQQYATHLTNIAVEFIFQHELSHILYGHVDFLWDAYGIEFISEYYNANQPSNLDRQTLEMDADATALSRSIWSLYHHFKLADTNVDAPLFYRDLYAAIYDIDFALRNIQMLFGTGTFKDTSVGKSNYPDPVIRHLLTIASMPVILKDWGMSYNEEKVSRTAATGSLEANRAYELLTGNKVNYEIYKPEYYSQHPIGQALLDHWANYMKNKLQPFTFIELAV